LLTPHTADKKVPVAGLTPVRLLVKFITGPLLEQPRRVGKQLLPPLDDRFSARRGTYRVIYRIDDKTHIVTAVDIGHRRDTYPVALEARTGRAAVADC
jgi:mRNA-degrading endonuclease RelE of RelBE toxin-antitoxin system